TKEVLDEANQLITRIPIIKGDKIVRDAVQGLLKGEFSVTRKELDKVRHQVGDSDKELVARIDALLPLIQSAERATADPLQGELERLEQGLASAELTSEDGSVLERLHGRLLDRRIRLRVSALPKDVDWGKLLADCNKVKEDASTWVLACRVECLVELRKTSGKDWDKARRELEAHKAEPETAAYAAYALALAENDSSAAAQRLLPLLEGKELPAVLSTAPSRRENAAQLLLAAAGSLRSKGQLAQPFGTALNAGQ